MIVRAAAEDGHWQARHAVNEMAQPPAGAIDALAMSVLTNGPLDVYLALDLYLRNDCPKQFESALLDRILQQPPAFRISLLGQHVPRRRDVTTCTPLCCTRRGGFRSPSSSWTLSSAKQDLPTSNGSPGSWGTMIPRSHRLLATTGAIRTAEGGPAGGRVEPARRTRNRPCTDARGPAPNGTPSDPLVDVRLAYAEDSVRTRDYRRLQSRWRETVLGLGPGWYTDRNSVTRPLGSLLPHGCTKLDQLLSDEACLYRGAPSGDRSGRAKG